MAAPNKSVVSPEEANKLENELLPQLTNLQWLMYPFVKTIRVFTESLCGRKGGDDYDYKND